MQPEAVPAGFTGCSEHSGSRGAGHGVSVHY